MDATLPIQRWNTPDSTVPSTAEVEARFPRPRYRVSRHVCPVGAAFPGCTRPGLCIVFRGSCRYRFEAAEGVVLAGQVARLPGGDYWFTNTGQEAVEFAHVWDLSRLDSAPSAETPD